LLSAKAPLEGLFAFQVANFFGGTGQEMSLPIQLGRVNEYPPKKVKIR
jgi:hypothetical protein